jgi:hypothetical protein
MRRQPAKKEIPRWRRAQQDPPRPVQVVQLRGRHARAAVRELAAREKEGRKEGTSPRGAWRFRRHVAPFAWLAGLAAASALRAAPHPLLCGLAASAAIPALMVLFTRHFPPWTRRAVDVAALLTAAWLPVLATAPPRSCAAWLLLTWAPCAALWARHYRWRPDAPPEPAGVPDDDAATWAALCAEQKWNATLGQAAELDGGGRRYPFQCDGIKTVTRKILAQPDNVAGAWHSAVTEVYAERDPKGVTTRGYLTILPGSGLKGGRFWDGSGMDPATGLARIGRFADGADAHEKWYEPRYGCYHDLDSGTTGSGKSELLNLKIFIALATGWFVPVILDPQEGQSLPFWRDRCIYASGEEQVGKRLRGLYAGFLDRSSLLSTWRWDDDGVEMPGMPFFDYDLLGGKLKIPLIILDEAHLVLKDGTKVQRQITADVVAMARLIRKAGGKMVLATQLPSLADLGGSQALRDMLRGGNVWSGRTANKVASGMLGLTKDPSEIPRFFEDLSKTAGLGYADGPDMRPDAPMRTDRAAREHYLNPPPVPVLDDRFLEVMDGEMKEAVSPTAAVAPLPAAPAPPPGGLGKLMRFSRRDDTPAPEPAPEPVLEGRRCVDAVWQVLSGADAEMTRGEIIKRVGDLARSRNRKPWSIKAIQNALTDLAEGKDPARRVVKPRDGVYRAVVSAASTTVAER